MQPLLQAKVVLQYDSLGQLAIRQFPAGSGAYKAGAARWLPRPMIDSPVQRAKREGTGPGSK